MNLEAQCLAMARDRGEVNIIHDSDIRADYLKLIVNKYTTREAVVEAIRRNKSNKIFKKYFSIEVNEVVYRRSGTLDNFFGLATIEACDLREAYLKARGLWVKEEKKDELDDQIAVDALENAAKKRGLTVEQLIANAISLKSDKSQEEEVVLPTIEEINEKMLKAEKLNSVERLINFFEPIPLSKEHFRNLLKSALEEARRGK